MTRDDLAQVQQALVAALVTGAQAPDGFDASALQATALALLNKRAGEVAHRAPDLVYEVGAEFYPRFREWARSRPKTTTAGDTVAFRDHLIALGVIAPRPKPTSSLLGRVRLRLRRY